MGIEWWDEHEVISLRLEMTDNVSHPFNGSHEFHFGYFKSEILKRRCIDGKKKKSTLYLKYSWRCDILKEKLDFNECKEPWGLIGKKL
jgi:hypothetical protein